MFYFDVHGQKIIREGIKLDKQLLIIDLDGTFVSVNTFHKWMKFLFIEELKKLHFISLFKILKIVGLRLIKSITHAQMKFSILQISEQNITTIQIEKFVDSLDIFVHHTILDLLERKNAISILATAAPLLYAQQIKEKYNFDYVIATEDTQQVNWEENLRERKKKNLLALLKTNSLSNTKSTIYTDHHDDLPLIDYVNYTYLVNPTNSTIQYLNNRKISYILL